MSHDGCVRLVAVGDIMLGRGIKTATAARAIDLLSPALVRELTGDIVTGNLECMVGSAGSPSMLSHSHFQGEPGFSRSLLERFDVVTLANNHAGDFGDEAIEETLYWLNRFDVRAVGIGRTRAEAIEPAVFEIRGSKVAVFGATTVGTLTSSNRYTLAEPCNALYDRARDYARRGHTCVLHLHAGGGDFHHPSPASRALLEQSADSGFSLVLGHHPHLPQGFLAERSRAIFYSLGDFVFDRRENGRDRALLVALEIGDDGTLSAPDVRVVRRGDDLTLALLNGDSLEEQMAALRRLSEMIKRGDSDGAFRYWRGSRLARLRRSLVRDFQVGGVQALTAKLGRLNTHKLRAFLLGG